jgi:hypothetical protein
MIVRHREQTSFAFTSTRDPPQAGQAARQFGGEEESAPGRSSGVDRRGGGRFIGSSLESWGDDRSVCPQSYVIGATPEGDPTALPPISPDGRIPERTRATRSAEARLGQAHHPQVPAAPLKGPTTAEVIQPP